MEEHSPRSLALMGGGTTASMSQGVFSVGLLRAMGSQYFYNALAQELTGDSGWAAIEVCSLDFEQVVEVCHLYATRKSSHESDLGVLMNRHSTLISYLEKVIRTICGRIGVKGGNLFGMGLMSGGPTKVCTREKEAQAWRTVTTGFFPITNLYPPNVMPEEILNDNPERLRAVIVTGSNLLRSFADASQYERAFRKLNQLYQAL